MHLAVKLSIQLKETEVKHKIGLCAITSEKVYLPCSKENDSKTTKIPRITDRNITEIFSFGEISKRRISRPED